MKTTFKRLQINKIQIILMRKRYPHSWMRTRIPGNKTFHMWNYNIFQERKRDYTFNHFRFFPQAKNTSVFLWKLGERPAEQVVIILTQGNSPISQLISNKTLLESILLRAFDVAWDELMLSQKNRLWDSACVFALVFSKSWNPKAPLKILLFLMPFYKSVVNFVATPENKVSKSKLNTCISPSLFTIKCEKFHYPEFLFSYLLCIKMIHFSRI